jgi:hypothetical protein
VIQSSRSPVSPSGMDFRCGPSAALTVENAVGAGLDDGRVALFLRLLREHAREDIGHAAGLGWHDHPDRLVGKALAARPLCPAQRRTRPQASVRSVRASRAGDQDLTKHQCLLWWHSPRPNALRPSPFPVSTICRNDFNGFHERAFMTTIAESDSLAARGIRRLLSNPVCIPRRTFAARVLTVPGLQETT